MLFNGCVKASYDANKTTKYLPDLCTVSTKDNQNYTISLNK
ncbi:MAG: hypothetical protein WCH65_04160 [bacterium]